MKYSVVLISAFAAIATAQAGLSPCGQTCFNNMLALAPTLGCPSPDAVCLCRNVNFSYGIHDCAYQACGADDAVTIVAYGVQYCQNAAASPVPTGSATETNSATEILTASGSPGSLSILPISTDATKTAHSTTGSSAVSTSGPTTLATIVPTSTISGAVKASPTAPSTSTSAAGGAKETAAAGLMAIAGLAVLVL